MKTKQIRAAFHQAKYGSGVLLLLVNLSLLCLVAIDIWHLTRSRLSYASIVFDTEFVARFAIDSVSNMLILLMLPIILVLIGNFVLYRYGPAFAYRHTVSTRARSVILLVHFMTVAFTVIHINSLPALKQAAGRCGSLQASTDCFASLLSAFEQYRGVFVVSILLWFLGIFVKDHLYKGGELVREFDLWRLLGPAGEYQPAYGDEIIYVNSASMAPSIKAINAAMQSYHDAYQRAVPTSDRARRILVEKANKARAMLAEYLLHDDEKRKRTFSIEFFPGTSRALEAGLLRISGITQVVLSQYEHPSQGDVARWLCQTHGVKTFTQLHAESPSFFQEQWSKQFTKVVESMSAALLPRKAGRVAVILSEVHYLTGLKVRVAEIIEALRATRDDIIFIIDASQAVGNLQKPLAPFRRAPRS